MHRCLGCMEEYKDEYSICPFCGYEENTPPLQPYHMIPGTVLNERYTIGKVVGFGGFGVTYIGYDILLDRKVAVKEYLPGEYSTRVPGTTEIVTYEGERTEYFQKGLDKFVDEAKMLAKMQTNNGIVQIYDSFMENSTAYIIMEYMEGIELAKYLKIEEKEEKRRKLSVEEAMEILHPILIALKEVHELGIIHRDIAPNNIFLLNDGRVKLYDFGASRYVSSSHSKSLSVIVKPGYTPVEQYSSHGSQGTWTDVYSLAATFYTMITGMVPEDAMDRVQKEELQKPSKMGIKIKKSTENALMNALNIKVEDRTQNIEIFERELYRDNKVKLHFVHLKKADVGKWPFWAKLIISTAVFGVVVFAGLLMTGVVDYSYILPESFVLSEGMTRVPNLVNEDVTQAETLMTEANLTLQIVDKQNSEYIPEGKVLSQNVKKGKIVHENDVVEVVVSAGREVLYMSDVLGMPRDQALEVLFQLGVSAELQEEYSSYAVGVVMAQSIAAGEPIYRGDQIVLTVSKGVDTYVDATQEIELLDMTGLTMEQALEIARKYSIYLNTAGTKTMRGKGGIIAEQYTKPGTMVHQGDMIDLIVFVEPTIIRMPDVQYKDAEQSVNTLLELGLKVDVVYEESTTVAQGKIIRQSINPNEELLEGDEVTIVISKGIEIVYQWSEWVTELPAGVDKSNYEIETKEQYRFRDKTTMSSANPTEEGWTLYDTTVEKGAYGDWSAWSMEKPASLPDREIDAPKVEYMYSHREDSSTTQTDNKVMSGWLVDESKTQITYDAWSDWSAFSEKQETTSDTNVKEVRTETWKKYRTKTYKTVVQYESASVPSTPSGYPDYEGVKSELDYSRTIVSDWTEVQPSTSDTYAGKTEIYDSELRTRTVTDFDSPIYNYSRWEIRNSAIPGGMAYSWYQAGCEAVARQYGVTSSATWVANVTTSPLAVDNNNWPYANSITRYSGLWFFDGMDYATKQEQYWVWKTAYTPYKYTFTFSNTSDWSNPVQTLPSNYHEQKDVTMYSYRTRNKHCIYYFYRWVDDVTYGDKQTESSTCKLIGERTLYRYRDKMDVYTYHYYKWGSWSEWRDEKVENSENREVDTPRTLYRYKQKQQ